MALSRGIADNDHEALHKVHEPEAVVVAPLRSCRLYLGSLQHWQEEVYEGADLQRVPARKRGIKPVVNWVSMPKHHALAQVVEAVLLFLILADDHHSLGGVRIEDPIDKWDGGEPLRDS